MNKGNIIGLGVMAAAAAAVVAVSGPAYEAIQNSRLEAAAGGAEITVVNGEAEGFGGPVQAEVTVAGDKNYRSEPDWRGRDSGNRRSCHVFSDRGHYSSPDPGRSGCSIRSNHYF